LIYNNNLKIPLCRFCITVRRWIFSFIVVLCAFSGSVGAAPRIASINLCSDQYLLALADKSQIVSVTTLAADPDRSAEYAAATGIAVNHGAAEEIAAQAPDLVLADAFSDPATIALIRRIGIRVLVLPFSSDFDGIVANVRSVAQAIGAPERGEALAAKIAAEIQASPSLASPSLVKNEPIVALVERGGYTLGTGSLLDEALTRAGGIGLARIWGLKAYATLPLERLVAAPVDLIVESADTKSAPSLGSEILNHPALRARFARTPHLAIPANLTDCAAPASAKLVTILRDALQALAAPGQG
jgi:iron complex transport system substrate-binding protein